MKGIPHSLETTKVVWDSFHLMSSVFPGYFRASFPAIKSELGLMVFGRSRQVFVEAYESIVGKLRNYPDALEYVKTFYDAPHRFAAFELRQLVGHLIKTSSQTAESNQE